MAASQISSLPASCYYVPSFISPAEEEQILNQIRQTPESRWTILTHRRLLSLPSTLTGTARDTLLAAPMPKYLDLVVTRLEQSGYFEASQHRAPNHVLINEYKPGQGIMPHEDGPAYSPITATVSLGSHVVLEIYKKTEEGEREARPSWRILQEPRSLLVTQHDMYINTLHGISEVEVDKRLGPETIVNWDILGDKDIYAVGRAERKTRVSLTLRDVSKVAKIGGALSFMKTR